MSSSTVPSGANEKCYFGGEGEVETVRGRSGVRGSLSTAHGHTPGGLTREVFFFLQEPVASDANNSPYHNLH